MQDPIEPEPRNDDRPKTDPNALKSSHTDSALDGKQPVFGSPPVPNFSAGGNGDGSGSPPSGVAGTAGKDGITIQLPACSLPVDHVVVVQQGLLKGGKPAPELQAQIPPLPHPRYPYMRGPNITNSGLAYGEVIRVTVVNAGASGRAEPFKGYSRHTSSGRQVISQEDNHVKASVPKPAV